MARSPTYVDIGYGSAQEFWDEIVLASASRFKTDPTRAHAMACAIYVSHFLDWVFHEKHPREDTLGNPVYVAFKQHHHRACPELMWLADLSDVAKHRGIGRAVALKRLEGTGGEGAEGDLLADRPQQPADGPLYLELGSGARHRFDKVVGKAVAYWRANR